MQKKNVAKFLLACLLMFVSFNSQAFSVKEPQEGGDAKVNTEEEISEYIDHHLADSHYVNFFSDGETGAHYGFSLPVILWDNGLKVFSSGKFHHGEDLAVIDGQHYRLYHSKIYKTDAEGTITYGEDGFPANERPLDFSITKNVLYMLVVSLLMLLVFGGLAKQYKN
ncbi:MAG: ATP synthase F0 subunit A, partial [Salinimicrobium sediminis]|nr:ATP synthase F0 subunit A [Salinimicrobium sediminis]